MRVEPIDLFAIARFKTCIFHRQNVYFAEPSIFASRAVAERTSQYALFYRRKTHIFKDRAPPLN